MLAALVIAVAAGFGSSHLSDHLDARAAARYGNSKELPEVMNPKIPQEVFYTALIDGSPLTDLQRKNINGLSLLAFNKVRNNECNTLPGIASGVRCKGSSAMTFESTSIAELIANNPDTKAVDYSCTATWKKTPKYAKGWPDYLAVKQIDMLTCRNLNNGHPLDVTAFVRAVVADLDREIPGLPQ